jgi:hypothetical protein
MKLNFEIAFSIPDFLEGGETTQTNSFKEG